MDELLLMLGLAEEVQALHSIAGFFLGADLFALDGGLCDLEIKDLLAQELLVAFFAKHAHALFVL